MGEPLAAIFEIWAEAGWDSRRPKATRTKRIVILFQKTQNYEMWSKFSSHTLLARHRDAHAGLGDGAVDVEFAVA
jgi:hypothetical protein